MMQIRAGDAASVTGPTFAYFSSGAMAGVVLGKT